MAGYSGKPLFEKLGIKKNYKIRLINPPENYFTLLGTSNLSLVEAEVKADFIHCFIKTENELNEQLPELKSQVEKNGMIWISWPKKTAKIPTDVNENNIRNCALKIGLVDVKVCAVDKTWSGLKLVYRLKDR
jgi:hypothetical protein